MKVKQVVIEWEEGGSTAFTRQLPTVMLGEIGELVNANERLKGELAEVKAHLEQAKKDIEDINRVRNQNYDLYMEITKKHNKLCKQIRELV